MTDSSSTPTPSSGGMTEAEAVVRLFGSDPWMRFDMWSSRAWESSEAATALAIANGPSVSSDDGLDPRILSMFHAAEIAKEFAEMVNPIAAVYDAKEGKDQDTIGQPNLTLDMIVGDND